MAYTKKTNNVSKTDGAKSTEVESVKVETEKVETMSESKKREFNPEDLISCRSMVSGQLFIDGVRSGLLYTFADYNDTCDIEYRDLIYMVRSYKDKNIYEPRIIIEDEDFIAQNPKLAELYGSMYTKGDLMEIVSLPTTQMVDTINALPKGCKNALKGIVATMIDNGSLDSIQKIKALDEIFETNMLLTLVQE